MKIVSFKHESGWTGGGLLFGEKIRRFPASGGDDVLAYIESGATSPLGVACERGVGSVMAATVRLQRSGDKVRFDAK